MWVSCHVGSAGLPMEHPYREPEIYVRPCYPYFYDLIKGSLYEDDEQGVTVSGTPGIGKSVFFAYFLVRYSEMNPGTTVITIPSGREGKHSVMEKLVVWRGGKIVGMAKKIKSRMFKLIEKSEREAEKRNEQVIQLYDGAPKVSPKEAKFVCFTSPAGPSRADLRCAGENAPEFGPPKIDLKENDKLHFCHLGGRRYCLDEAEPWTNR
ncbi:hypothetical protein Poli38472_014690 [Pythium oligandrum]|uniref:Uncharacterized protein n=1 Tax=Pythium oligandrum TaxID=41045 RepID=A0A8K1CIS4_PYTOL|nr:hypothetical protein Poli38472_014690 [Pythium oligandrum]|eukprot:TMW63985.1 hypothetical protein Poli38472_014690 [Pythium oligandrum]